MRIWSLHPSQLDRAALIAGWRETLLAQAVLAGKTKGYRNHPQLLRFRRDHEPLRVIGGYLTGLLEEAGARGYRFDAQKILLPGPLPDRLYVTSAQLDFEWQHLGAKLAARSPELVPVWEASRPRPHPIFRMVPGEIESWERP